MAACVEARRERTPARSRDGGDEARQVRRVGCWERAAGASGVEGRGDERLRAAPGAALAVRAPASRLLGTRSCWQHGGSTLGRRRARQWRLLGTLGGRGRNARRALGRRGGRGRTRRRRLARRGTGAGAGAPDGAPGRGGGWRLALGGKGGRRLGGKPIGCGRRLEKNTEKP
jgi:hypothetical protein